MDSVGDTPDVLVKIDALLTRHRTGAPTPENPATAAEQAERAAIPVLTDIVAEPDKIPILTEALPAATASEPEPDRHDTLTPDIGPVPSAPAGTDDRPQPADILRGEEALHQIEEFLMQELENRIALELTAVLDRALEELLERSREHIRHAVREALGNEPSKQLDNPPGDTADAPDPQ